MLKSFLSRSSELEPPCLEQKSYYCCSKHDTRKAWIGQKPTVDHFIIFSCIAYAHVPDEKRMKLDNKGEKCLS